jgi:N-acetyl sugar amidotransferase
MKYCLKCVQPDSRPGTEFVNGVCPACEFRITSTKWDWQNRKRILKQVVHSRKAIGHISGHDSILGVSGGKDSTRLALFARDFLGLNPLLVAVTYPPEQMTITGAKNLDNLSRLGFDVYQTSPSPITWKSLMRAAFLESANWAKSTELALFSGVPQIAIENGIELILWGENPALQLGALETLGKEGWDGNSLRNMNTLTGMNKEWLLNQEIDPSRIGPYLYPSQFEFEKHNLQIVFLGWAMGNWGLLENGLVASLAGLQNRSDSPSNTSDLINLTSLDEDWVILNQMIKYYKFGFGRATDYVNEWIRTGRVTRSEGIPLVQKYDGVCADRYIASFSEFIGITTEDFWLTVRKFTNSKLFDLSVAGRPRPLFEVGQL